MNRLGDLGAEVAASLIAAAADIALVVDSDGIIRDVSFGTEDLLEEGCQEWLGRRFVDTVTVESRGKIEELLAEAALKSVSRWRQVNHPSPKGADLPVRYSGISVGRDGRIVAVGRDLRSTAALQQRLANAQQTMEREYERIRSAETRYRLLFQLASEPVLIVDVAAEKVSEANPAAIKLIGLPPKRVTGRAFADLFDPESALPIQSMLGAVRVTGQVADVRVRLADSKAELLMAGSLFRQENSSFCLVRLSPLATDAGTIRPRADLQKVLDTLPEGFVVTDDSRRILSANSAFLDLAQLATEEQARGELLDRWVGREGVDIDVLVSNLRDHGSVRHFSTVMRGEYGSVEDVEIAAVAVLANDPPCMGFTIRSSALRTGTAALGGRELPRSVEQFTELVGRVSLKNLVRETTDMIERLCIEAALELTRDNRASAAEMLGLSRQGLYAKLRRYGLGDLDDRE